MIPESELAALHAVILRMEEANPLTELEKFYQIRRRKFRRIRPNEEPEDYQAAMNSHRRKWPIKTDYAPRVKDHPVYGDTNFALGFQVGLLSAALDNWFTIGADVPPNGPATRIPIILKRAKMLELRGRFISAYDKHFHDFWKEPIRREPSDDGWLEYLQGKIPRLKIRVKAVEDTAGGKHLLTFEFHCCDCGGWEMNRPDGDDEAGPVVCRSCGAVLGSFHDMRELATHIGKQKLKSIGVES